MCGIYQYIFMQDVIFEKIKTSLSNIDPVHWAEQYLTLDGKPYRLRDAGYRPVVEIMRCIGVKNLGKDAKPVIILKSRQIGMTVSSCVLEMFFMCSGLFGNSESPPIRIAHIFPWIDHAASFSKTKLSAMIDGSMLIDDPIGKRGKKPYIRTLLDTSSSSNDNLQFKQFKGGNHIWLESAGLDGSRLRGKTVDIAFFDECLPYEQCIETNKGKMQIGSIYNLFIKNNELPLVKTFNEQTKEFEFKKVVKAWNRGERDLLEITAGKRKIKSTLNHKFLTSKGYVYAGKLKVGDLLIMSHSTKQHLSSLNDDQLQVVLGSFLGDGNLSEYAPSRYRLRILHGYSQKDYCDWKASLFGVSTRFIEFNGTWKKPAVQFNSTGFALDEHLPKNKYTCPQWVLDKLDARGIAIWFMDDGSIGKNKNNEVINGTLYTCSFDDDSQNRFIEKFKSIGINCTIKNSGKYKVLVFGKNDFEKLSELISPYIHSNIDYKIIDAHRSNPKYIWNNKFNTFGYEVVNKISYLNKKQAVYDIEVEDNHNFIITSCQRSKNLGGIVVSNCQDIPATALANSAKILTKAQYGSIGDGVQVYFGTPKQKGSDFWRMWQQSSQQYYHLGCEKCKDFFPLYTPGTNEWESIWLYGNIVKCTHCGYEQERVPAINRGKWIATRDPVDAKFVGFHLNQLYMPEFTKEKIIDAKPENSAINTERAYQNEVLGEFFQGETAIITPEEIREKCGDPERKFRGTVTLNEELVTFLGVDIGAKSDLEQLANSDKVKSQGQSYSTAVVLSLTGPGRLSIEYAFKFKRNDLESKKSILDETIKRYRVKLAICDIGYAHDFNEIMQTEYGEKFLASQASGKVSEKVKYNGDIFPKVITFERDFWIMDLYEQMKKGLIRFPLGSYEQIAWLMQHCTNMEIKPSISRTGDVSPHYVKSGANDGFMALLNAYIAYKFYLTKGFQIKNPLLQDANNNRKSSPSVIAVYSPR